LLNVVEKSLFELPKVVHQEFVGEVGTFIFCWCQVSSGWHVPKIIKICLFLRVIQKI